jgi:hypothetical protein
MNVHDKTKEVTEAQETGWRVKTPALLNSWQSHVTLAGDWPEAVLQPGASPLSGTFTTTSLPSMLAEGISQNSRLVLLASGQLFLNQVSLSPSFPAPRLSAKPSTESASIS